MLVLKESPQINIYLAMLQGHVKVRNYLEAA
jgi:hypothetical protein